MSSVPLLQCALSIPSLNDSGDLQGCTNLLESAIAPLCHSVPSAAMTMVAVDLPALSSCTFIHARMAGF